MDNKPALHTLLKYCSRLLIYYCIFYYGTIFITGLAVPGNYYSSFVEQYLNYPAALRKALLETTRWLLEVFGHTAVVSDIYHVRIKNAIGVKIVYSCLGTGVLSFWAAFIIANKCAIQRKIVYLLTGLFSIFLLNALRLALLVVAANFVSKGNNFIIQNHHLLFNTTCYGLIILMMVGYDLIEKRLNKNKPMAVIP